MTQFIQLHLLTAYPPSNLNRDDLGRPKTAIVGGTERLRISSQSRKRAWRTSDVFLERCKGKQGKITRRIGYDAAIRLQKNGFNQEKALEIGKAISEVFLNPADLEKKDKSDPFKETLFKQPFRVAAEELEAVQNLVDILIEEKREPQEEELDFIRKTHKSIDIAMFGRMLASKGRDSIKTEAAVQVAHAITVHKAAIEDDYFSAVEDLNENKSDEGAAFISEAGFSAGVFYQYLCIDRDRLVENLQGDEELAKQAIAALTDAAAKVAPTGKQNSFASRAYTSYLLAEKGSQQPRSLSVAFLKPVRGNDLMSDAIAALEKQRENFDRMYGDCADERRAMNAHTGEGATLEEIIDFVAD